MNTIRQFFSITLLVFLFQSASAQTSNPVYVAHFNSTDESVYRDQNNKLVMTYTIEGIQSRVQADEVAALYGKYNMCESVTISPTSDANIWTVYEVTKPDVKVKDHRKLFVSAGIMTVFVDGEPYPAESFSLKMLPTH